MLKLVKTVNAQHGENALSEDRLRKTFDRWWAEFETEFKRIVSEYKPLKEKGHQRDTKDMVAEILEVTRSIQKMVQQERPALFEQAYTKLGQFLPRKDKQGQTWLLDYLRSSNWRQQEFQANAEAFMEMCKALTETRSDAQKGPTGGEHAPDKPPQS
jgi:hypothetical protein